MLFKTFATKGAKASMSLKRQRTIQFLLVPEAGEGPSAPQNPPHSNP